MALTHKVIKGETLTKLANRYNVSVDDIVKANSKLIKNKNSISVGWVLTIPTKTASKNYANIGKQLEVTIKDIENLASFKKLKKML